MILDIQTYFEYINAQKNIEVHNILNLSHQITPPTFKLWIDEETPSQASTEKTGYIFSS